MSVCGDTFNSTGSDKESLQRYGTMYDWLLRDLRDIPGLRLVELGVLHGCSLRAWEKLLPLAEIIGVDSSIQCANLAFNRACVIVGDATKPGTFADISCADVVIDDAGHHPQQQLASLRILWPRTKLLYVVEDVGWVGGAARMKFAEEVLAAIRTTITNCRSHPVIDCWTIFARDAIIFKRIP